MTATTQSLVLKEFSERATLASIAKLMREQKVLAAGQPVGFMVASDVWDHILYRADVLTEIKPDSSLHGYSGFLGLPVAVDAELKMGAVDIIYDQETWAKRMLSARQVAPPPTTR